MLGRQLMASVLIGLLAAPAWAAADPAVGMAGPTEAATVRGASLAPEAPLFSGDIIDVGTRGAAALNFAHGSMVQLGEKSTLRIEKGDGRVAFELLRGSASFRSSEAFPVEAHFAGIRIRSANGAAVTGAVKFRSPKVVAIAAEQGNLLISTTRGARDVSLRAGEILEMRVDAPRSGGDAGAQASQLGVPHHGWLTAVLVAGLVGVGVGVAVARGESGLNGQQKQTLVSPFTFPPR